MGDAAGRIGLFTDGMMRHRREIAAMTGLAPARRRWSAAGLAAVGGWGRRPTTAAARAAAARAGLPFLAFEDGFLRSVDPGNAEAPASYVLDRTGIYYDARTPSDLEALVAARTAAEASAARDAAPALRALRERGLSKYNRFEDAREALAALPASPQDAVLLVDQTRGDASVEGAGATAETFRDMIVRAAEAAPGAMLVLKTHPETALGRRAGHFDEACLAAARAASPAAAAARIERLTARARPAELFARVGRVHAVSSLMGFEALVHGLPVTCHGAGFYAGWGLTEGLAETPARRGCASLEALTAAAYLDYCRWFHPRTRTPCTLEEAAEALAAAR